MRFHPCFRGVNPPQIVQREGVFLKSRFFVQGFGAVGMVISGWFFTQAAWVLAKEGEGKMSEARR
jgi:hypothetical protein